MAEYLQMETDTMRCFCEKLFASYGFTPQQSEVITDVLLRADLYGIESHGVQRLVRYHKEIGAGVVDVAAEPQLVHETPVSAVMDAGRAMGQLAGLQAMRLAIQKAKQNGIGMVAMRNSNHYGIAGYYTGMAVEADLLGICMTNTEAILVPTNGKKAMLGTNPIAVAMPAEPVPFSFDAATTVVPRGKIEVYEKKGEPLPEQWALDAAGQPTTDATGLLYNLTNKLNGGIAPLGGIGELFGGHKGYGLATIVDIFTGILSGGLTSNYLNLQPGRTDICHFFAAMDYGLFGDKAEMKQRLSTFLRELRDSPKAEGESRIYTAGEKEAQNCVARRDGCIPVNEKTLAEMKDIAAAQEVAWPFADVEAN